MIKPALVILSDINGNIENDWLTQYTQKLEEAFNLVYFDVRELAEIEHENKTKEEVHVAFVDGGIDDAVSNLMQKFNKQCLILAFSIGGVIAWKASLKGFACSKIFAISSTRLRKEYQNPKCEVDLYFGENDMNRPMDEWFEEMQIAPIILKRKEHDMYQEQWVTEKIVDDLLQAVDPGF